jgi:hypothetical protein
MSTTGFAVVDMTNRDLEGAVLRRRQAIATLKAAWPWHPANA